MSYILSAILSCSILTVIYLPLSATGKPNTIKKEIDVPNEWEKAVKCWREGREKKITAVSCITLGECEIAVLYGNIQGKAYAAGALSVMGPGAVPALIKALKDVDVNVRALAVNSLAQIGPDAKDAIPALIELLPDLGVSREVETALARIGKAAIPYMLNLIPEPPYTDSEDSKIRYERNDIRRHAVMVLGRMGVDAVPILIGVLQDENGSGGQDFAAEALGKIGPEAKDAVPALIKHIKGSNRYQKAATQNLGKYQWTLKAHLESIKESDSSWAAVGLGGIGPAAREAVPTLIQLLSDSSSNDMWLVKWRTVEALGKIGPDSKLAVPLITEMLKDVNSDVKSAAITALGQIGPDAKEAIPSIKTIIKYSESADLRKRASISLEQINQLEKKAD